MVRALALLFLTVLLGQWALAEERFDFRNAGTGGEWAGAPDLGWGNLYTKKARARATGIGLAPPAAGESGMRFSSEAAPVTIASLSVVCQASSASAAGSATSRKVHQLGIALNGGEFITQPLDFAGEQNTPVTLTFPFDSPQSVSTLDIANRTPTGTPLFEVAEVSWLNALPALEVELSGGDAPQVCAGEEVEFYLSACTGGTGTGYRFTWQFLGESRQTDDCAQVAAFTAPLAEGTFTLSLTVEDSGGNTRAFDFPVTVLPYAAARSLQVTDFGRTHLTLAWEQPYSGTATDYRVILRQSSTASIDPTWELHPAWVQDESDGSWRLQSPISLTERTNGQALSSLYLQPQHWDGASIDFSTDGGQTWRTSYDFFGLSRFLFGAQPAGEQTLDLRVSSGLPPPHFFTLCLVANTLCVEQTLSADMTLREATFTDLPPGAELSIQVCTTHATGPESDPITLRSQELSCTLKPIPPPCQAAWNPDFQRLMLTWPDAAADEEAAAFPAKVTFYAEQRPPAALAPGLYLTRVYFTGTDPDTKEALPAGKAIALTNTSSAPIALDGTYVLQIQKTDGSSAAPTTWDFRKGSITAADGTVQPLYPYVIPPRSDVIFYSSRYTPPVEATARSNAAGLSVAALNNLTPAYTATLLHQGAEVNALIPAYNTVVRLWEDSLTEQERFAVPADALTLPALYEPWFPADEQLVLSTATYAHAATDGASKSLSYAGRLPDLSAYRRVWGEARLYSGTAHSQPLSFSVKEPAQPGFLLLLR